METTDTGCSGSHRDLDLGDQIEMEKAREKFVAAQDEAVADER
jgi:hypothetical protein